MTRLALLLLSLLCLAGSGRAALLFDATDDRVLLASATGAPTGYPMAVVVVANLVGGGTSLVSCGYVVSPATGYSFFGPGGGQTLAVGNHGSSATISTTGTYPTNTWMLVGWSAASATSHRFYVYNYATQTVAVNETSATNFGAITAPGARCKIGASEDSAGVLGDFLNGTVQWIGIYASDFTIQNGDAFLAMAHLGPYAVANPVLLYTFHEMAGTAAQDRRGTGNVGTLSNFTGTFWQPLSLPGPLQGGW